MPLWNPFASTTRSKSQNSGSTPQDAQLESFNADVMDSDDDDDSAEHQEAFMDHKEEKLTRVQPQIWALGLGMLALPLLCWATRVPISCVEHTEQQRLAPMNCSGLDGDAKTLRLPDFCWQACFQMHKLPVMCLLTLGLFLQSAVVMLNRPDCANWLRLVWYFDVYNMLEKAQEHDLSADHLLQDQKTPAYIPQFVRRSVLTLASKLERSAKSKLTKGLTKREARGLASAKWASWFAKACIAVSACSLCLLIITMFSKFPVSFSCEGGVHVEQPPAIRPLMFITLFGCVGLLLIVVLLMRSAEWTIQIKVEDVDAPRVSNQFRKTHLDGKDRYFQRFDVEPLDRQLSSVQLHELIRIGYNGAIYKPGKVLGKVPQEAGSKEVTFFFKKRSQPHLLDNIHRKRALYLLLMALLLLYLAGTSCWTCIRGIHASPGTSVTELDRYLLLMGACGRHAQIGGPCKLACMLFLIAIMQQALIFHGTPKNSPSSLNREQLMFATLVDFRKLHVANAQLYEDVQAPMPEFSCHVWVVGEDQAGEKGERVTNCRTHKEGRITRAGAYATLESIESQDTSLTSSLGTVSEVFRMAARSEPLVNIQKESVSSSVNQLASEKMNLRENRDRWRRSKRPKLVRLSHQPIEIATEWSKGLMRPQEYNPPSICIEFDVQDVMIKQIVPPEFVAGHFHAAVNLGPRVGWEKMSAAFVLCGCILALFDVICFFFLGRDDMLTRCSDIFNRPGSCVAFHLKLYAQQSIFIFRHSLGAYSAIAGGAIGLLGMLELRVAYVNPDLHSSCGGDCLREYCRGLRFGLYVPFNLVMAVFSSIWDCMVSMYKSKCVDFKEDLSYRALSRETPGDSDRAQEITTRYSIIKTEAGDDWTSRRSPTHKVSLQSPLVNASSE